MLGKIGTLIYLNHLVLFCFEDFFYYLLSLIHILLADKNNHHVEIFLLKM